MKRILWGLTAPLYLANALGGVEEYAHTLTRASAQEMDLEASKSEAGRLEKRAILAHFEHENPQEIDQPGVYMRTYADCLMKEDNFFEAGRWFYRAAHSGLESARFIFRDKKIPYTQWDEETCARAFEKHWIDFIG